MLKSPEDKPGITAKRKVQEWCLRPLRDKREPEYKAAGAAGSSKQRLKQRFGRAKVCVLYVEYSWLLSHWPHLRRHSRFWNRRWEDGLETAETPSKDKWAPGLLTSSYARRVHSLFPWHRFKSARTRTAMLWHKTWRFLFFIPLATFTFVM